MPFLGGKLPDIRLVTAVVDLLRIYDVQYQFRIDISAGTANTDIRIGIFGRLLEIDNRFYRIPIIDRIPSPIQQPKAVEQLIDFRRWLVNIHDNQPSTVGLFLQQHNNFL